MEPTETEAPTVFRHAVLSFLGLLFVAILFVFNFDGINGIFVDILFRSYWKKVPHPAIALIEYTPQSESTLPVQTRIPINAIEEMFTVLREEKPFAVAWIGPLNEPVYSAAELTRISNGVKKMDHFFVGFTDDESLNRSLTDGSQVVNEYFPGFISRDTYSYGADSVSRRVMITLNGTPSVYAKLACLYRNNCANDQDFKNLDSLDTSFSTFQTYIHWTGDRAYQPISVSQIIKRQFKKGMFTDKIVLIGNESHGKESLGNIRTPYSRLQESTSALQGAAQGLATLLRNDGIKKSNTAFNLLVSIGIGMITVNLALFLSPISGILFVAAEFLALLIGGWLLLYFNGIWLDLAHPVLTSILGYYLVIPFRLIDEYRKRWHYQEETELMVELQQLKNNFLSLISHDLKTPVSRIHGNAELLLSEAASLTDKQRKLLLGVLNTTADLSEYVETILDLARMETATVQIQKVSRDINTVITEVADARRAGASEKSITLNLQLETLFSIKFDVRLIRRVLSNLLENAIKYSDSGTQITMSSREEGGWVKIQIIDQGCGISKLEREKVFEKFYRCDNDTTRKNKGTGLGLYLVRYFVQLHDGKVELNSWVGHGTTVTVLLPMG